MEWKIEGDEQISGIHVRSLSLRNDCRARIEEEFDLGVFFGTYESRGLVSSKILSKNACRRSIVVLFREVDKRGLRQRYDVKLVEQVKACTKGEPIIVKDMSVRNVEGILKYILKNIRTERFSASSHWFFDIVGCPKPYFLGLLGYMRRQIEAPLIHFFHPGGYYEKAESSFDAFSFTSGFDSYMWVPWMWGRPVPARPWTYLFLLGFEGNRSFEVFSKFEPKFCKALIGRPGYRPDYFEKAIEANAAFLREAAPRKYFASALDVVSAWRTINCALRDSKMATNICIVPLGPKPHALAGGLAAMCDGRPSVLYLMPSSFKVHDVWPSDRLWRYEVRL